MVCLDTTILFHSPIQITISLPLQKGEEEISTDETVIKQNGNLFAK